MTALASALMAAGFKGQSQATPKELPSVVDLLVHDGAAKVRLRQLGDSEWKIVSEPFTQMGSPMTEQTHLGFRSTHSDARMGGSDDVIDYCKCSTQLSIGNVIFTPKLIRGTLAEIQAVANDIVWVAYCPGDI